MDDLEEAIDVARREHRGRLVEDEDPSPPVPSGQGRGDGHDGALNGRGLGERVADVELDVERGEQLPGALGLGLPPHPSDGVRDEVA